MRLARPLLVVALAAGLVLPASAAGHWTPYLVMFESGCKVDCMYVRRQPPGMTPMEAMSPYADWRHAGLPARHRARRLLDRVRLLARRDFPSVRAARRMGYEPGSAMSAIGMPDNAPFIHYDNWHLLNDRHHLDPHHPESLVYWRSPTGALVLVGYMFREHAGDRPPGSNYGAMLRWHAHAQCGTGSAEAWRVFTAPSGHCDQTDNVAHFGAWTMVHVWLTPSIKTAFATPAPAHALGIRLPNEG